MRVTASENLKIIQLIERSNLPVRRTLVQLGIPKSTFYGWYRRYVEGGLEALEDQPPQPTRVWNKVPGEIGAAIIELALTEPAALAPGAGCQIHRHRPILPVRIDRLPAPEGPDHEPRLHRDAGGGQVQSSDHAREPALADGFHLSEGHRLGVVLPLHRAR